MPGTNGELRDPIANLQELVREMDEVAGELKKVIELAEDDASLRAWIAKDPHYTNILGAFDAASQLSPADRDRFVSMLCELCVRMYSILEFRGPRTEEQEEYVSAVIEDIREQAHDLWWRAAYWD